MKMDILKSQRLIWTINNLYLDDPGVTLDGHRLTQRDLDLLDQPVHLKTENLILYLNPIEDAHAYEIVEFATGPIVTPLQILGAIYTYYDQYITEEDLDRIEGENADNEMVMAVISDARNHLNQGLNLLRSDIMRNEMYYRGITEDDNGTFTVGLEN